MIARTLASRLRQAAATYPVVTVTGPRQSGKTTLVQAEFPRHQYVSLERPDTRAHASEDPLGFLAQFKGPAILDEVQRVPDLFSYLQVQVDSLARPGQFILTGSQNFLLLASVSQSLAGRCAVLHLLPLSVAELAGRSPLALDRLGEPPTPGPGPHASLFEALHSGGFPRIHDQGLDPWDWLANYHQTYLERDVRTLLNIGDLDTFGRFVRLCAGRSAQILDLSGLAADAGVTHTTARRWLSVLQASFAVTLLQPHHRNFRKRLVRRPKLYFLDSGLLCFLLQIRSPDELSSHAARGAIFETFVLSELLKNFWNRGEVPSITFWRDSAGHEVDFLVDLGSATFGVEAKSGQTFANDFLAGLDYWRALAGDQTAGCALVYGGDQAQVRRGVTVHPWFGI